MNVQKLNARKTKYLLAVLCVACMIALYGCTSATQKEKVQKQAIEGYMQGLFGGDLEKFVQYASYGYALDSMNQRNLANLFVSAESTRAKAFGGYKEVQILSIAQAPNPKEQDSQAHSKKSPDDLHYNKTDKAHQPMPTARANVRVVFGKATLTSDIELVNYEANKWIVNSMLSLKPKDTLKNN
ncbi:hypothetical protein OQH61_05000 [Helicobacter sp. MIT 21-1697]|uniref:hypothetical protein n=1 Tax=Helicobacter sp. MIT 21-1697 TaxID=2993733 RepID=UPI00224B2142|nr:hypothetical protein [Helicobacter sp. MIT 21-1697]MCX2717090.1 hypothetical protein [Helicobacter sp. MIT 21-1697]